MMLIQASCYFIHRNRGYPRIVFIRFDDMVRIYFNNDKPIVIKIEDILNNKELYEYYLVSLLLTENPNELYYNKDDINDKSLYISSIKDWKRMHYNNDYENNFRVKKNIFLQEKPKRVSSNKKLRKFKKKFNEFIHDYYYPNTFYYIYENPDLGLLDDYIYKEIESELEEIECAISFQIKEKKRKNVIINLCYKYNIPNELIEKIYFLTFF